MQQLHIADTEVHITMLKLLVHFWHLIVAY